MMHDRKRASSVVCLARTVWIRWSLLAFFAALDIYFKCGRALTRRLGGAAAAAADVVDFVNRNSFMLFTAIGYTCLSVAAHDQQLHGFRQRLFLAIIIILYTRSIRWNDAPYNTVSVVYTVVAIWAWNK